MAAVPIAGPPPGATCSGSSQRSRATSTPPEPQAGAGQRQHVAARDGDLEISRQERIPGLLGVVLERTDDLQDPPDVADLPVRLAELVELVQLGIAVAFQAPRLQDQRRGVAEHPGAGAGLLDPVER